MSDNKRFSAAGLAVLLAFTAFTAHSVPLPKHQVAADAKWLVHIDLDDFLNTQVGDLIDKRFLAKPLAELTKNLKFDAHALLKKFSSVTAYGVDYAKNREANLASGILIIRTDAEAQKIVEGLLAAQILADTNGPVTKLQTEPYPLYSIAKELFAAVHPGNMFIIGKSRPQVEKARAVLLGQSQNLTSSKALSEYPDAPDSFFCLALAEGFSEHAGLPTQAKVLQMTDGARVVLGEQAGRLFLNLDLKARTTEVVTQIQQVIQGAAALFALGDLANKDVAELVRAIKVTANKKVVSIALDYPVAKAIAKLGQEADDGDKPAPRQKMPKKSSKKKSTPAPEDEDEPKEKEESK